MSTDVSLVNVFDNEKLHVDFKPLFECIHIYTTLNALAELQKSYQADRKVCTNPITIYHINSNFGVLLGSI